MSGAIVKWWSEGMSTAISFKYRIRSAAAVTEGDLAVTKPKGWYGQLDGARFKLS